MEDYSFIMNVKKEDFPILKLKPEVDIDRLPGFTWLGADRDCGFLYKCGNVYICSNSRRLEFDKLTKKDLSTIFDLCCRGYIMMIERF